jgi:DNA-directed RNA polymerase subunit omega
MMIKPSIVDLMKKVDSRYTLVILASKRARMLNEADIKSNKAVSIAIEEINDGKIYFRQNSAKVKDLRIQEDSIEPLTEKPQSVDPLTGEII